MLNPNEQKYKMRHFYGIGKAFNITHTQAWTSCLTRQKSAKFKSQIFKGSSVTTNPANA